MVLVSILYLLQKILKFAALVSERQQRVHKILKICVFCLDQFLRFSIPRTPIFQNFHQLLIWYFCITADISNHLQLIKKKKATFVRLFRRVFFSKFEGKFLRRSSFKMKMRKRNVKNKKYYLHGCFSKSFLIL